MQTCSGGGWTDGMARRMIPAAGHDRRMPHSAAALGAAARHAGCRSSVHFRDQGGSPDPGEKALPGRLCAGGAGGDGAAAAAPQLLRHDHGGPGAGRSQAGRGCRHGRRGARPAARRSRPHQGPCRRRRYQDHPWHGDLRRQCGRRRRRPRRAPPPGRRRHRRQDHDAGIRQQGPDRRAELRHHAQSLEPRAHARRVERRSPPASRRSGSARTERVPCAARPHAAAWSG
ncbi:hypothetical protein BN1110_00903 [bacterium YEK0313]|nr:hypothetical protein BN1110_00903 [bacterium YEK0313]